MTPELKIEVGKFYRTRSGCKARIYATDGAERIPVHGAFKVNESWISTNWGIDGKHESFSEATPYDLISEWADPVEMDWSALPRWVINSGDGYIAMNEAGDWRAFIETPYAGNSVWMGGVYTCFIPPSYAPKWTGDWRQSLTKVPRV